MICFDDSVYLNNFLIRLAEELFGAESHRGKGAALVRGSNPVLDWLSVFDVETIVGRFSGVLDKLKSLYIP